MSHGAADGTVGGATRPAVDSTAFRKALEEWYKDHKMFAATLERLAGQLATLEPPATGAGTSTSAGISASAEPPELMQRLLAKASSAQLQAYASGTGRPARLQRLLPEQLDQNLRLLGILALEMRGLLRQMEGLTDAAAAALAGGDSSSGSSAVDGDEALLMAGVLDGAAKEMHLIETAAEGITLTTPSEEVAAAATLVELEPFVNSTLLAAVLEGPGEREGQ